ncbi:uncharacterized protein LOC110624856 isoform X2 [Manihot esculenta]|uniref:uncharacterized protein LOC110624856 isoform X2 n=1 Tax=Manihot esculenta TaxID=3983 RepID=UPI000B5D262F|nr:uncharacterized protein LOC110624856 isoform X2 [Manihot esculenta]
MGEHIDKDVSGSTVLESSKETVSDRVASGDSAETRVVEAVASDDQFQGQGVSKGSSAEGVVTEKGGSCNGADTVAGVMGSDIYVDGVCTRNSGGENLSEEATKSHGQSRELASEGDVKAVGGGCGDSNSKVDEDPSEEASNLGTESEVEKSSVFADSKEGELVEDGARVWEEKLGLEIEVGNSSGVAESKEEGELVENAASVREVDLRSDSETEVGTSSELAESKEEGEMVEGDTRVRGVNLATGCEIKCSGVAESKEEGVLVEGVARVREITGADGCCVADGITLHEIDAGNPQNVGIKSAVEDSSLLEGSSVGETKNVVEKEAVGAGKESLEGGLGKECVEKVEMHFVKDMISQEVRDSENEASNRGVENFEDSSAGLGSSVVEAQDIAAEKSELVEEVMDQAKETHDNEGAVLQNSEPEKVGALDVEEWNPGIRTAGAPSSTIKEGSCLKTHCIEEEAAVMADIGNLDSSSEKDLVSIEKDAITNPTSKCLDGQTQVAVDGKMSSTDVEAWNPGIKTAGAPSSTIKEGSSLKAQHIEEEAAVTADIGNLDPKVETVLDGTHRTDPVEGVVSSSEKDLEKDAITNPTSKSLDGQTQVAVDGKISSNEEIACPNIEGMDTDAFNENFCFSVEELQAVVETPNGSTENHCDAFADLQSSQQPTQVVVGGEVAATENKVHKNSENERKLIIEESSDQMMPRDFALAQSTVDPEMGVDEQVTGSEQASMQKDPGKVETANAIVSTEIHSPKGLDLVSSHQSAPALVGDEVVEMNNKIDSDTNFEGQVVMHLDGMLSSSGNEQHVKTEVDSMEIDTHTASTNKDKVHSTANVSDPAEKDPEVKVKEHIDKSEACDSDQSNPNIGQLMDAQEQVTHFEQLGKEETEVVELNSEAGTVCGSRETDTLLINGPDTGLQGPPDGDQTLTVKEDLDASAGQDVSEIGSSAATETVVEEHDACLDQVGLQERQEMEAEGQDTDFEQPNTSEEKFAKQEAPNSGSTVIEYQACYQLPPDDEGEFTVSDLVWGKVRSHPWWPGQIFYPSDASEKAMKYHKKDCFLVAYFGDRTFAWNEASLLKPFRSHFSLVEKQSNSEAFQNAVDCALEEVSRRVEFGLACSCIPKETYDEIKFQIVENTGIREEASVRDGADKSLPADLFEPGKLMEYMKALAQCPAGGADRLELVIARSQLLAFYRLKGYSQLPEFQVCGGLLENAGTLEFADEVIEHTYPVYKDDGQISSDQEFSHALRSSYHKRKHNLKDTVYPRKKERSLSELMGDSWDCVDDEFGPDGKANNKLVSPSSGRKRKVYDSFPDDSATAEGRKTISLANVSTTASKPSFKIGECIRRVASQMTGSTSILKSNNMKQDGSSDRLIGDGSDALFQHSEDAEMSRTIVPTEYSSLDELLSQLHLAAQDPFKGYSFLTIIVSFFSDFRNSVIVEQHEKVGGKRKQASHSIGGLSETFEFEDMSDTYWTDRVIQNGSEEQPRKSRKRDNQLVLANQDKALNMSNSRKRYSDGNHDLSAEKPVGYIDENAPAELVMHFPVVDCVPAETSLNKMFRRFGPLKELETEVDKDTNRARVVFKKCSDAEAAYGSAPKFNIFGSILVNYQLNYTVSVPFKSQPMITLHGEEDATLFLEF